MSDAPHNVPLRSARDRVIDLLGIGDTYPLTDLEVPPEQLKVAFGGTAKISVEDAQAGVLYQLCEPKEGKPLGDKFSAEGLGKTLVIESPKVAENVTYRILATKKPAGTKLPPQPGRFLEQGAPVEVGIDKGLAVQILQAPPLDPANPNPQPSDPRIVAYGTSVEVEIDATQEGVEYSLILDKQDVKDVVRTGDLHAIRLPTGPRKEDTFIQVRATKNFLASEKRDPETVVLLAELYLKVKADPAAAVSVSSSPVVDYLQDATVKIAATQKSAKYRAYARAVPDADFVRDAPAAAALAPAVALAPVPGRPGLQVRKPDRTAGVPEGYAPLGDALAGGGDLQVDAKALTEDAVVIVQAIKEHRLNAQDPLSRTIVSAVWLEQAAVVLVRPDPARALKLRVPMEGAQTGDSLQARDGQPGVFYYLRRAPAGAELPLAAYFHKRDARDGAQNKGVGQLGVEIDLAVAADAPAPVADRARAQPETPRLDIVPFAAGGSLSVRAVKAQTGIDTRMAKGATVGAVAAMRADPAIVERGASPKIVVSASDPQDRYQLVLDGAPVGDAPLGNGADLVLTGAALGADALFEIVVTRVADQGLQVDRVVRVPVKLKTEG